MLGSTPITAVLGSGVDNTDHEAVRHFIRAAADAGLSLLFIKPGTKMPFDGRTVRKRQADDRAAQQAAQDAGRGDYAKIKSASGLALATSNKDVLERYLKRYIEVFGDNCAVNLAVEVGGSRLVVVDADTRAQVQKFFEVGKAPVEFPPTVVTPGAQNADGTWAHSDGGHFYFTIPDGVTLPKNVGALTWGGEDGFAVLWDRRYVLIPPSTRPEGAYELVGREYDIPDFLIHAINEHSSAKVTRTQENAFDSDGDLASEIDQWASGVTWASILEPMDWTLAARPDNCGCEVWTAPGEHSSPKSATAHDSGCVLGRYTETNAPLHIWTDHPGEPFDSYIAKAKTSTMSKLQAVAWSEYEGDVGKTMDVLGLAPSLTSIEKETGTSKSNLDDPDANSDAGLDIVMPTPTAPQPAADEPFGLTDEDQPNPDVFECGINGVPIIAPFSHWRDMTPPEYVVEGLIEHGGLSAVIGPPGVGKSTVALDMACHIATGKSWQGRRVLKTRVLYLPGEGLAGAVQRIKAWGYEHDTDDGLLDDGLRLGNSIIQLQATPEAWGKLIEYITRQQIGLVIFDTFARMALGMEENSATEVGKAVVRFDRVRQLTNAGVLIVHHTAKHNPSMARGSSALNGALDSEILVSEAQWNFDDLGLVDGNGRVPSGKPIQLSTTKQKNAEQLENPIPLLMRSCAEFNAPFITAPNGETDPMLGDIVLASPVDEPVFETAIRVAIYADDFIEQGVTRSDIVSGVRPDAYTAHRKDASKAWRQKVNLAVDLGLRYGLIETASGQRLGTRYLRGSTSVEQARVNHAAEVIGDGEMT